MNRRRAQPFSCEPLANLTRQLLFSPADKRVEQVRRAERLHDQIDVHVNYPFDFISYRITGYHTESQEPTVLVGEAVLPDLRRLIGQLSRSIEMPQDPDDPIEMIPQIAQRLNVSTKTIERYRRFGLRWRWVKRVSDGRKVIGFTRDAVDHFLARYSQRVKRASHFSQIAAPDRQKLVDSARQVAVDKQLSLNQVARRLACESGRAVETIRLLLEEHDRTNPQKAIFPDRIGQLTSRQKQVIDRAMRIGVRVDLIATRFGRSRSTIYRAARDRRAAELHRLRIAYVDSSDFHHNDADELILAVADDPEPTTQCNVTLANGGTENDLPHPLRLYYRQLDLGAAEQRAMLVRYNYLKFKAAERRRTLNRYEPRANDLAQIDAWLARATRLRRHLIKANLHAVLVAARRHLIDETERSTVRLADMLIAGHAVLGDAVEQFDITQRQSFASYVTWCLMRCFAAAPKEQGLSQRRLIDEETAQTVLTCLAADGLVFHE